MTSNELSELQARTFLLRSAFAALPGRARARARAHSNATYSPSLFVVRIVRAIVRDHGKEEKGKAKKETVTVVFKPKSLRLFHYSFQSRRVVGHGSGIDSHRDINPRLLCAWITQLLRCEFDQCEQKELYFAVTHPETAAPNCIFHLLVYLNYLESKSTEICVLKMKF